MEVIIVPVAHVSEESIRMVREVIEREKPDVVAVELDAERFDALANKRKPRLVEMVSHPFLAILYLFQQAVGRGFRIAPGSEMLAAVEAARSLGIPVVFADRPIGITAARLSRIPLREKLSIILQLLLSPIAFISFLWRGLPVAEELAQEKFIKEFCVEFKRRLPNTYKVLVEERDEYMFEQLMQLDAERVVLVIGAGHMPGIRKRMAGWKAPSMKGVAG